MKRILIVEGRAAGASGLQTRLERLGFSVVGIADSGEGAFSAAARTAPDVVLMDMDSPGPMDGIEASVRLANGRSVPVVFIDDQADDAALTAALHPDELEKREEENMRRVRTLRRRQALTVEILGILNAPLPLELAVASILSAIQKETDIQAAAIRLRSFEDFPYFVSDGFSSDFLSSETFLIFRDQDGAAVRGVDGNPCLECLCGQVVSGRTDPADPLFSPGGSAWTNDGAALPGMTPERDSRLRLRSRCFREGFSSVALIPIHADTEIVGLLQLNDRRKDRFDPELIEYLESVSASIGVALMRKHAERALERRESLLNATQRLAKVGGWEWDCDRRELFWTDEMYRLHGWDPRGFPTASRDPVGRSIECYRPEDRPAVLAAFRSCAEDGIPYDLELPFTDAAGRALWVRASAQAIREDGRIVRVIGLLMDITERKQLENVKNFLLGSVYSGRGSGFFEALARYLGESLGMDYVSIDRFEEDGRTADKVAVYCDGKCIDGAPYSLAGTPGGEAAGRAICRFERDVRERFPDDAVLQSISAESYLGATLRGTDGKAIGLIGLIGRKPLDDSRTAEAVLEMAAIPAAGVLERERAAEALESIASLPFENPNPVFRVGGDRIVRYGNPAGIELLRDSGGAVGGEAPVEWWNLASQALSGGTIRTAVFACSERIYEFTAMPVADRGYVNLYALDVTARKRAESVLEKSERRYKTVIENIGEYVYSADYEDGQPANRYHSPKCRDVTGYDPSDFESDPSLWLNMIHEEDRPKVLAYLEAVAEGKASAPIEYRIIRKDGRLSWVMNTCTVELGADGKPRRTQGFIIDMNERILMEHEILEARNAAEAASRAKSDFLAAMSHELRTPLHSIIGFSQLLALDESGTLSERHKAYVQDMRTSGEHLLGMIGDILDLAEIESGKIELAIKPFDLGFMIRKLAETMEASASEKSIRIKLDIDPEVGVLNADEVRMRQILYNLLSNAIQFTDAGKTVGLEARGDGNRAVVVVWDEGVGISGDDQERIFDPFEQVRRLEASCQGTGLGLSITQRLVALHGGRIDISSRLGRGSRFTLTIPGRSVDRRASAAGFPAAAAGTENAAGAGVGEILIVEDNPVNRKLLQAILRTCGYASALAASGEEAVDAARSRNFALILMDINLPGIDGIEAMKRIRLLRAPSGSGRRRDSDFRTPIIALTAYTMKGDRERFISEGMDDVLPKPIDIAKLRTALERFLPKPVKEEAATPAASDAPSSCGDTGYDAAAAAASLSIPEDSLRSLLSYFFSGMADAYMAELTSAIEKRGIEDIRASAHKLRGIVANLRLEQCAAILEQIEAAACGGQSQGFSAQIERLEREIELLRPRFAPRADSRGETSGAGPIERLRALDGVDVDTGLLYAGSDRELYGKLLESFAATYAGFQAELSESFAVPDRGKARRIVHGLKGAAANLGFTAVAAAASRFGEELSAGDPAGRGPPSPEALLGPLGLVVAAIGCGSSRQ